MKKATQIYEGQKYHVDCYDVKQYESERFVDTVEVLEVIKKKHYVLCYSPKYMANVLIPKRELKSI